jgi:ketosteroid isomerase-like protein
MADAHPGGPIRRSPSTENDRTMISRLAMAAMMMSGVFGAAEAAAQGVDLAHARESLRAADRAHAAAVEARGVVDGLPSAFADDVYFLREGADVVHGLDAVRADLPASPLAGARLAWTTIRADVSADGTRGYTYGGGTYTAADGAQRYSRTLAFWRNDGGTWKVAAFVLNLPNAPAQPAPDGFFREDSGVRGPAAVEEIMQADRDFAARSAAENPAAAFRAWIAADGALLGGPLYGPDALYEAMRQGRGQLEWAPVTGEIAASGDLGFTIGLATSTSDTGAHGYTKYLTVWRRQPGGEWRFVVDGGNPRPAPGS